MTAGSSSGATVTAVSVEDGIQSYLTTNNTVSPQKNSSFQNNLVAHVVDSDPPALATASIDSSATRSVPLRRGNHEGTTLTTTTTITTSSTITTTSQWLI